MNKEKCALKLVYEIILYYDARSKKNVKLFTSSIREDETSERNSKLAKYAPPPFFLIISRQRLQTHTAFT